jgi:hypothetical protein
MTPYLDKDGNVTYSKTSQSRNLVQASKTAHKRGGRVVEVDGHSNRIVCDFWAGSEIESRVETMLKAERTTYKSWKLSHNCAQLFTS